MQVGSTRAEAALLETLDAVLGQRTQGVDAAASVDGAQLGTELFAVAHMLDDQPVLRRTLTEPSVPAEARRRLAESLLTSRVSGPAVEVVSAAVEHRWSRSRDLADTLERCAVSAAAAKAEQQGQLDALEDDLFRFGRILQSNAGLRDTLNDRTVPVERRQALLDRLLEGKVSDVTRQLLRQIVTGRQRTFGAGLAEYQELAAARRRRMIATVWVAKPLNDEQKQRLAASLAKQYSREVHVNVIVDPSVLGGVRVAIGDDVIDSTIATRLAQAQRMLR